MGLANMPISDVKPVYTSRHMYVLSPSKNAHRFPKVLPSVLTFLTASLAGAALDANPACACADDFVAAAYRTGDSHEDAAKRYRHAVGRITGAVTISSRADGIIGRLVRDHVDHLFVASAR